MTVHMNVIGLLAEKPFHEGPTLLDIEESIPENVLIDVSGKDVENNLYNVQLWQFITELTPVNDLISANIQIVASLLVT